MRPVESRAAPLVAQVEEILRDLRGPGRNVAGGECFVVVAEVSAPGVICSKQQASRHALVELDVACVVFSLGACLQQVPSACREACCLEQITPGALTSATTTKHSPPATFRPGPRRSRRISSTCATSGAARLSTGRIASLSTTCTKYRGSHPARLRYATRLAAGKFPELRNSSPDRYSPSRRVWTPWEPWRPVRFRAGRTTTRMEYSRNIQLPAIFERSVRRSTGLESLSLQAASWPTRCLAAGASDATPSAALHSRTGTSR